MRLNYNYYLVTIGLIYTLHALALVIFLESLEEVHSWPGSGLVLSMTSTIIHQESEDRNSPMFLLVTELKSITKCSTNRKDPYITHKQVH